MMRQDSIPVQAGTCDCGLFAEGTSLGSVARKCFEERKMPIHLTEVNGHIKSGLKMECCFSLMLHNFGENCANSTLLLLK